MSTLDGTNPSDPNTLVQKWIKELDTVRASNLPLTFFNVQLPMSILSNESQAQAVVNAFLSAETVQTTLARGPVQFGLNFPSHQLLSPAPAALHTTLASLHTVLPLAINTLASNWFTHIGARAVRQQLPPGALAIATEVLRSDAQGRRPGQVSGDLSYTGPAHTPLYADTGNSDGNTGNTREEAGMVQASADVRASLDRAFQLERAFLIKVLYAILYHIYHM